MDFLASIITLFLIIGGWYVAFLIIRKLIRWIVKSDKNQ